MRTQPDAVRVDSRLHPIDIPFDALVVDEDTGRPQIRDFHGREFNRRRERKERNEL